MLLLSLIVTDIEAERTSSRCCSEAVVALKFTPAALKTGFKANARYVSIFSGQATDPSTSRPGWRRPLRLPEEIRCYLKFARDNFPGYRYLSYMQNGWNKVYALVKRIPKGRVITYGQLARAVRLPGGARAAGRAMAATPRGQGIPWHRVVAASGRIAVREPYASLQRRLLEAEGTHFVERRVALADHLWTFARSRKPTAKPKARRRRSSRKGPRF